MATKAQVKYKGKARRLLLAFDIGTTFSGISYSILDPGRIPEIRPVTRFPSQERVGGDNKIPTVIYYNAAGKPVAFGAETLKEGIEADAEESGWVKAHWFKLHLRPKPAAGTASSDAPIPPLPPRKTVIDIFKDFMGYLFKCAQAYVEETHGAIVWNSVKDDIMYVLTHPNGWGGPQQAQMRDAAVRAELIPDTVAGRERVTFVTEGEASLHFCLSNGLAIHGDDEDSGVLIVDAGGGTIDITAYRRLADKSFEEIAIPTCDFQGGIYVTMRAEQHFRRLLKGTRFEYDVLVLTTKFDRSTKHVFKNAEEPHHIQFASIRERDQALNIRGGRITIDGDVIAAFFAPSIKSIVDAIQTQKRSAHFPIKSVFLVGGFSASNWLYEQVRDAIEPLGITVSRPDTHVNKAVSNGGVSFYLDGVVRSRVSRYTYGIRIDQDYDPEKVEHRLRSHLVTKHPVHGGKVLYDVFSAILLVNTRVKKTQEFRQSYSMPASDIKQLKAFSVGVLSYCGESRDPLWIEEEKHNYKLVCTVAVDTSSVKPELKYSEEKKSYYCFVSFQVVLLFGLTELKAQIAYQENGVEKTGPAQVMYT